MTRLARARWRLWLPLLLGAGALAFFGDKTPTGRGQPAVVGSSAAAAQQQATPLVLPAILPVDRARLYPATQGQKPAADLFAAVAWLPTATPPVVVALPRAETQPLLPLLTVVGKKYENSAWEVYLVRGDQTLIAREGATLDDGLRVERIAPPTMTLTMHSTGQTASIDIGEAR